MHLGSFVTASNIQTVLQLCSLAISSAFLHFCISLKASKFSIQTVLQFCQIHAKVLHFHHFKFLDHSIFAVSASDTQILGSNFWITASFSNTYTHMLKFCIFYNTYLNFAVSASKTQNCWIRASFSPDKADSR